MSAVKSSHTNSNFNSQVMSASTCRSTTQPSTGATGQYNLTRIQDVNHERKNLGKNLDSICSQVSIEIERLYQENHELKIKNDTQDNNNLDRQYLERQLNELSKQIREKDQQIEKNNLLNSELRRDNTQIIQQVEIYKKNQCELLQEIQNLKGYKEKSEEFEQKIVMVTQEISRLNLLVKNKEDEILNLNSKNHETSCNLSKNQQDLRNHEIIIQSRNEELQSSKNNHNQLSKEVEHLKGIEARVQNLQCINQQYSLEIESYTNQIDQRNQEINEWKQKTTKLEIELAHYKQLEQKLHDYEARFGLLSNEIERLNGLLHQRLQENNQQKDKHNYLESQLSEAKKFEIQSQDQQTYIHSLHGQIDDHKKQINSQEGEILTGKQLNNRCSELENRIVLLTNEIERLNVCLRQKGEDIDQHKERNIQLQSNITVQESKQNEYESRIMLLTTEIERQHSQLEQKSKEVDSWKEKSSQLEINLCHYKQYEQKSIQLQNQIQILQEQLELWQNKNNQYETELIKYKQVEVQCSEFEKKVILLTQEIERLNSVIKQKLKEIEDHRNSVIHLQNTCQQMKVYETKVSEYENRLALLSQEIERLNGHLKQKIVEADDLSKQNVIHQSELQHKENIIQSHSNKLNEISNGYNNISIMLQDKSKDHEEQKLKTNHIHEEKKIVENQLQKHSGEIETLKQRINMNEETEINLRNKNASLEVNLKQMNDLQAKLEVLNNEIERLEMIKDELNQENNLLKYQHVRYTDIEKKYNDNLGVMVLLFVEVESLRSRMKAKEREIDDIRRSSLAPYMTPKK